jgi:acetyl esterase/lipase
MPRERSQFTAPVLVCMAVSAIRWKGRLAAGGDRGSSPSASGLGGEILISPTRFSNTVRVHRKLRQAGVEAVLQVFEGQSHAHYLRDDSAPETHEVFNEISGFFDRHLAR